MLAVTDNACALLAKMLDDAKAPEGSAARFAQTKDGLALGIDTQRDGDQTFEHDERTVLVVADDLATNLDGRTLDVQKSEEGSLALTLR